MDRTITTGLKRMLVVCIFSSLCAANIRANERGGLEHIVTISKNKGTIYELLKEISEQSGYLFIYDSQIIDNDRKVKVGKGSYTLREAVYLITGNRQLQIDLSGMYILLRLTEKQIAEKTDHPISVQPPLFNIKGLLYDNETGEPLIYATIRILHTSIGTITNQNGEFQLYYSDTLQNQKVRFSYIGYESREIDLSLLQNQSVDIGLSPQIVSLQEIVVQAVHPVRELKEMLQNRALNYSAAPVSLTTFYREGINHQHRNIDLTESVLQVYKTEYQKKADYDQVKLIKKRRIINRAKTDTIFPRMRSGIRSCLILDIIKELPDFIIPTDETPYTYSYKGKSIIDNQFVNIIAFQQHNYIKEPLYTGELFIETENKALVEVRFEINPKLANKATHMFVDRKAAGLKINLQQAKYIVSYRLFDDGRYHINHARGDIRFKVRRKKRLLSTPLHCWFEMATCDIHTQNIKAFPQNERLSTTRIFAETKHEYDRHFWENFNIILPEEELQEEIIRNLHELMIIEE